MWYVILNSTHKTFGEIEQYIKLCILFVLYVLCILLLGFTIIHSQEYTVPWCESNFVPKTVLLLLESSIILEILFYFIIFETYCLFLWGPIVPVVVPNGFRRDAPPYTYSSAFPRSETAICSDKTNVIKKMYG